MSRCNQPCEIYSRVCGYHRPIKNWNKGKVAEFRERKVYATDSNRLLSTATDSNRRKEQPQ